MAAADDVGDQAGPAGLVRRAQPGAVVAVEVLVEHQVVLPRRVVLQALDPAEARPPPVGADQEDRDQPLAQVVRRSRRAAAVCPDPVGYSTVKSSPKNRW